MTLSAKSGKNIKKIIEKLNKTNGKWSRKDEKCDSNC